MSTGASENFAALPQEMKDILLGIKLDSGSAVPLHVQIRDSLAAMMDNACLAPGTRLPTLRLLAASCGVSLRTAAQAVELLQREGRVSSRVGRGVFVNKATEKFVQAVVYVCLHPAFLRVHGGARFRTLQGIIGKAKELGVELHPVTHGAELDLALLTEARTGVVFMNSSFESDGFGEIARFVLERGIPHCVANDPRPPFRGVDAHHEQAICLSTEHLLRLGHERVAFVNRPVGEPHLRPFRNRQGYLDALRRYGLMPDPDLYGEADAPTDHPHALTEAVLDSWLALAEPPTAIVCESDERALLMLDLLKARGLRVPQDISLVGHENLPATAASDPPLTTVDARCPERGEKSVEYVLDMINGKHPDPPEVLPGLVVRESAAPLAYGAEAQAAVPGGEQERRRI